MGIIIKECLQKTQMCLELFIPNRKFVFIKHGLFMWVDREIIYQIISNN